MNINDTYNEKIKKIINDIKSATDIKSDIKPLPSEIKNNYIYYLKQLLEKYKGDETKLYFKLINIYNIYIDNYDTIKKFATMSDTENKIYENIFSESSDSLVTRNEYIFLCIVIITIKIKNRLRLDIIPDLNYTDVFSSYKSLTDLLTKGLSLFTIPDTVNKEIPIAIMLTVSANHSISD
jgi:hypothetical protein